MCNFNYSNFKGLQEMARLTNSNSESESKTKSTGSNAAHGSASGSGARAASKQRLTTAQNQYIKDLVKKHITNNHPDLTPDQHPVDFESYPDKFLRRYKDHFNLDIEDNLTLKGYMLGSQLGSRTYSAKLNQVGKIGSRVAKSDLAKEVKKHFTSYGVKENICIPQFIYRVKNQKKNFKMEFKE